MNSKTLLGIISAPQDSALVARHWPYMKLAGWDILGIGSEDGKCEWPEPVLRLDTGKMGKKIIDGISSIWGLCEQELDALEAFLTTQYTALCVIESDNIFVRKPPEHPRTMLFLFNLMTNLHPGIFKTPVYASTPRYYDRETAGHVIHWGRRLIAQGDCEKYISDRFFAYCAFVGKLRFKHWPSFTAFPHGWSGCPPQEAFIKDARAAIAMGDISIHGVKTAEQLDRITDGFQIL